MRMRGKLPIFNYNDTFSLDSTLSPIIHAGLVRFKEVLRERHSQDKCIGVPPSVFHRLEMLPEESGGYSDKQVDIALEEWFDILDKMIIGFSEEPDIEQYDVHFEWTELGKDENGYTKTSLNCLTPNNRDVYYEAVERHHHQALEGRRLFAEYFEDLWW